MVDVRPPGTVEPHVRFRTKRPALTGLVALFAVALAGAGCRVTSIASEDEGAYPPPAAVTHDAGAEVLPRDLAGLVRIRVPLGVFAGPGPGQVSRTSETGAGLIVSEDGHILTCAHCLGLTQGAEVWVSPVGDDRRYRAEVIHLSPEADLALLRVFGRLGSPARWAGSSRAAMLKRVILAGFPVNDALADWSQPSISQGIVSCPSRRMKGAEGEPYLAGMLEVQAWADRGYSGGPVIVPGEGVIGICSARLEDSGAWAGHVYAIPVEAIRAYLGAHLSR